MATHRTTWLADKRLGNWAHWRASLRQLDYRDPASWPGAWQLLLLGLLTSVVFGLLWFLVLQNTQAALTQAQQMEHAFKADYQSKLVKTVNLTLLQAQREQIGMAVQTLEQQLPSQSEMAALLSDINQAGLARGLQFLLFRPEPALVKDHYAELPITLRVVGHYDSMGLFAADVAALPRIVTLTNLALARDKEGVLTLDATAKTFRYLDQAPPLSAKPAPAKATAP
jgi:type IV pilus assembly protein PilO